MENSNFSPDSIEIDSNKMIDTDVYTENELSEFSEVIDVLATDFLSRIREGHHPTIEEYVRRHPEYTDQINHYFPLLFKVEKLKYSEQAPVDGSVSLAGGKLERLGDFRIIREIGRGGMGVVFEAEQESLNRYVAIKVLPKHCLMEDNALERFQREARTAAGMHHSNIVPIYGTGEADGTHYLVMQLIHGEGLDQRLQNQEQSLSFDEIAKIGVQTADALAYAHESGVLHRDIKPGNILLDNDGNAQITDFGLAKTIEDDQTKSISGSLRYMAPERFRGSSDPRGDIYSLGVTLYELITSCPAFEASDSEQLMHKIANQSPVSPKKHRPDTPLDLETIVLKAISAEPNLRYQNAEEMRDDLQNFLDDRPIKARRVSYVESCIRWCRRNSRLATAVFITALALLTATIASTAGFILTSAANRQTTKALEQSENTVDLALSSLDGIVDVFSLPTTTIEIESGDFPTPLIVEPSPRTAVVLERIQPLYERLLAQIPNHPKVIRQMTEAGIRLSQIQYQLGRNEDAVRTIKKSIKLLVEDNANAELPSDEKSLKIAKLYNNLGTYQAAMQDFKSSSQSHKTAIQSIPADNSNSEMQFEIACAHLHLGSSRPRRRRDLLENHELANAFRKHLDIAITIFESLVQSDFDKASVSIFLARSYLARARLMPRQSIKQKENFASAISMLERLLESSPESPSVRFELVQAFADITVRRNTPFRQDWDVARNILEKGLKHVKHLRDHHPESHVFANSEVHIRHKLSVVNLNQEEYEQAIDQIKKAIAIQNSLIEEFPENVIHICWQALLFRSLAEVHLLQNDIPTASENLEKAFTYISEVEKKNPDHRFFKNAKQRLLNFQETVLNSAKTQK